ncbi:MAG: nitroreductase family deazaflavin-dependent oxidoreductase [Alphaproteobacteria bacterium]
MTQPGFAKEHVDRYRASDGADGHIWVGFDGTGHFPCLLLTTTGRKSGEARTTPLIYGRDGDDFVVNILDDAAIEVQVAADVFTGTARTADAAERARLWPMMAEIYPPYDAYQEKAADDREIPVVILSR